MVHYWGIRLGEGGKYVEELRNKNLIGIGWEDMGDLTWLLDYKEDQEAFSKLKKAYKDTYGTEWSNNKIGIECSEMLRFVKGISEDDVVVVPNPPDRSIHIGRVTSVCLWKKEWGDNCPYQNRRKVNWIKTVSRSDMSVKLKNSLVWLTIMSLESHSEEVESFVSGKKNSNDSKPVLQVSGHGLRLKIIDRIKELDAREFEEFVSQLLEIMGFESANRQHVGDNGIDIDGVLNTELGSINLKVQVKRITGSISNDKVLQMRGTLSPDEHGSIVTTGTFTKPAIEEAEAPQKKFIKLVDREDLVEIILTHYDELDVRYKQLLNLKKKDIPLTDQFIMDS